MTAQTEALEYETAEQRHERIQEWRLWKALQSAPELFTHARTIALSRSETGETLREWNAPMRITTEDDSSERFARLSEWVDYFATTLNIAPPVSRLAARRIDNGEVQGFRAHTTPDGAGLLVNLLTSWLSIHAERMQTDASYVIYRDDVLEFMGELRRKYPLDPGRPRDVLPRPCPECGIPGVQAEWWSANTNDVEVACAICGYTLEPKEYAKQLRRILPTEKGADWIDALPSVRVRCTGSANCGATEYIDDAGKIQPAHIHGCFADTGNCNEPREHNREYADSETGEHHA